VKDGDDINDDGDNNKTFGAWLFADSVLHFGDSALYVILFLM
jgi:hypothetical protein